MRTAAAISIGRGRAMGDLDDLSKLGAGAATAHRDVDCHRDAGPRVGHGIVGR